MEQHEPREGARGLGVGAEERVEARAARVVELAVDMRVEETVELAHAVVAIVRAAHAPRSARRRASMQSRSCSRTRWRIFAVVFARRPRRSAMRAGFRSCS